MVEGVLFSGVVEVVCRQILLEVLPDALVDRADVCECRLETRLRLVDSQMVRIFYLKNGIVQNFVQTSVSGI